MVTKQTVELDRVLIRGLNGSRREVSGTYDAQSLINVMVNDWLGVQECHKCERWGDCPFGALPHGANPNRSIDGHCGAAVRTLEVFIKRTFYILCDAEPGLHQKYIDGAQNFCAFISEAEPFLAELASESRLDFYGAYAPNIYGYLQRLRCYLDDYSESLSEFSDFRIHQNIILCEGYTEELFIEALKRSNYGLLPDWRIHRYSGRENGCFDRLMVIIKYFKRKAYKVHLQADGDGRKPVSKEIVKRQLLPENQVFSFAYDFETSIPLDLLWEVLSEMMSLPSGFHAVFMQKLSEKREKGGSVILHLYELFDIDIKPFKLELAEKVGACVIRYLHIKDHIFFTTELGQFVSFLIDGVRPLQISSCKNRGTE